MFLYIVYPHACYTAHLYGPCYLISMMTLRGYLTFFALPKHKLVKLAALSCNVGGDRFAAAVDASNILTDVFHVYSLPNRENSGVNTPLSSHDRFFPHPTQYFIDSYPALHTSNFVYLAVGITTFSDRLA